MLLWIVHFLKVILYRVIEGIMIGAYAIGATAAYIYCRAEYPLAIERFKTALAKCEEYGILGR